MLLWVLRSILMLFILRSRKHVYNIRKMSGVVYNRIMWYTSWAIMLRKGCTVSQIQTAVLLQHLVLL